MDVLWTPPDDVATSSRLGRFLRQYGPAGLDPTSHQQAWEWSVRDLDAFWRSVWQEFNLGTGGPPGPALADDSMPGAVWFPEARVNYARKALGSNGRASDDIVIVGRSQTRDRSTLTHRALRLAVALCRTGLQNMGVGPGDRVAAYLPNIPEALIAFLATASLGAVWASVAPEFGVRSVLDRLRQIDPKVLLAVDGYRYGDRDVDRRDHVARILRELPSVEVPVIVGYLDPYVEVEGMMSWHWLLSDDAHANLDFVEVPFDHPLYVLFSSGTTGLPKPIVHGHGGIMLEHVKQLGLMSDVGKRDRFFWFSTTGWMMWNYLVSGRLVGATLVFFDGDPGWPDLTTLWRLAEEEQLTYLGLSAPFIMACRKAGLRPGDDLDLSRLRGIGSTGAPLPAAGFHWVHDAVSPTAQLGSLSGGTDVCTGFVGPSPLAPVRAGQIPARSLGASVEAWDADGNPVVGSQGELVLTRPMPSMPVGFWGDDDGSRYRDAYFSTWPGVWDHGDWITIHEDGSCVITGRSDATLNRGGVRMGTSEFYTVVDRDPAVSDSLVVHLDPTDPEDAMGMLVLFVAPSDGTSLDDQVLDRIRTRLRDEVSPRHVPDHVAVVPGIPRTLSGKRLEIPVKRILMGTPRDEAVAEGALANPESLDAIVAWARRVLWPYGVPPWPA